MNELQIFKNNEFGEVRTVNLVFKNNEFGEVRTVNLENEIWFVLTDICTVLGLTNPSVVANRLDDDLYWHGYNHQ